MTRVNKIEISGNNPVELAVDFLKRREEAIDSVTIEITEEDTDEDTETSTDEVEEEQQTLEVERERGDIRANTSHHRVLHALSNIDQPAAGKEIEEEVEGVNESSIYPALTQLYQRMLVDRKRIEDAPNPYHVYEVTDYGIEKLDELGEPAEEE